MILVVNFKNYKTGKNALKLAKTIQRQQPNAIVCPESTDIRLLKRKTDMRIFAQHVDAITRIRKTGYISAKAAKMAGAKGTLLNHSEHRIPFKDIKQTIKDCNKEKIKIILCVSTLGEAKRFKQLKVYAVAYEDPKLVGTGKSITKYRTKNVEKFAKMFKNSKTLPMCGAGINSTKDVLEAKKLGCKGVLIASAIAKSKKPKKLLKQI